MISLFFSPFLPFSPLTKASKPALDLRATIPLLPRLPVLRQVYRPELHSRRVGADIARAHRLWLNFCEQNKNHHFQWKSIRAFLSFPVSLRILFAGGGQLLPMRCFVGTFAAALGFVAAVGAFHTPYRPEQSRHYDVTKTNSFHPITEKVFVHLPPLSARAYLGRCNYLAGYPFYCWCN